MLPRTGGATLLKIYKSTDSKSRASTALNGYSLLRPQEYLQPNPTMNALAPTASFNFTVPEWLQRCLNLPLPESESASPDRTAADAELVCLAFEFAYQLHQ